MVISHAFAGALTTYAIKKTLRYKFTEFEENIIWFFGIVAAVFPDFDLAIVMLNRTLQHRYLISHSIITYVVLSLLIFIIGSLVLKNKKFSLVLSLVFFVGVFSHLFLDYLSGGVAFLVPFSFELYGYVMSSSVKTSFWIVDYIKSQLIMEELMLFLAYLLVRVKVKNIVFRWLPLFLLVVSIFATYAIIFL